MNHRRRFTFLLLMLVLIVTGLGCRFTASQIPGELEAPESQEQATATPEPTEPPIFPAQALTVEEPGGARLQVGISEWGDGRSLENATGVSMWNWVASSNSDEV